MVEVVGEVQPVNKVMAIADKKYSNRKSVEDEEKELEELIQQQTDETEAVEKQAQEEEEPENPEEKTFKKRYVIFVDILKNNKKTLTINYLYCKNNWMKLQRHKFNFQNQKRNLKSGQKSIQMWLL